MKRITMRGAVFASVCGGAMIAAAHAASARVAGAPPLGMADCKLATLVAEQ
jgi:hypothetical protein